jgi:hypothetical protein
VHGIRPKILQMNWPNDNPADLTIPVTPRILHLLTAQTCLTRRAHVDYQHFSAVNGRLPS